MNCLPATMTDTINTLLNMQMGNPQSEITFDTAYGSMTMYTDRVHQNDLVMRVTLMTPFRPLAFALTTLDLPCTRADKVEAIWEGLNAIEYPTTDANGERLTPPADEYTCPNCHSLIDDDNGGCDCDRANAEVEDGWMEASLLPDCDLSDNARLLFRDGEVEQVEFDYPLTVGQSAHSLADEIIYDQHTVSRDYPQWGWSGEARTEQEGTDSARLVILYTRGTAK